MLDGKATKDFAGCGPLRPQVQNPNISLRRQIFDLIRAKGSSARAEVTKILNISGGSATAITAELIAQGVLAESEFTKSDAARGRPRVALTVVGDMHHVIGVKLSERQVSAYLSDFAGVEIAQASIEADNRKLTPESLISLFRGLVAKVIAETDLTQKDISAIAIGISGIVDSDTGVVIWSPHFARTDFPLADLLQEALGLAVFVDNDANMRTLDALWFGAGRKVENFSVVTLERGIGMGLVLDSILFRGSRGIGLELGHTKVQLDGALCRCGQRGCLEAYVADYALSREAMTALEFPTRDGEWTSDASILELLHQEAEAGNQRARSVFQRAGRHLALGIANVVQLFDPKLIILVGSRIRYYDHYAETIIKDALSLTLSEGRLPPKIVVQSSDGSEWARGAAAFALIRVTDRVIGGTPS